MTRKIVIRMMSIMAVTGIAHAAVASGIPEPFQGFWEKEEICSKALDLGMPDMGLIIREDSIVGYEQPCDLKTIHESRDTALHATFECNLPDGSKDIEYRFEKLAQDKLQYHAQGFESEVLVRCEE